MEISISNMAQQYILSRINTYSLPESIHTLPPKQVRASIPCTNVLNRGYCFYGDNCVRREGRGGEIEMQKLFPTQQVLLTHVYGIKSKIDIGDDAFGSL